MKKEEIMIQLMTMSDIDELRMIRNAINDRIQEVGSRIKYELKPGDSVIVKGGKKLSEETGTLIRCNRTKAIVLIGTQEWNVPFTMLSKAQEVSQ